MRIYLTSSQEHFQQDEDSKGEVVFEQRRDHRTQLIIDTPQGSTTKTKAFGSDSTLAWSHAYNATDSNRGKLPKNLVKGEAGAIGLPLGPLPYIYKTYSTVGGNIPTQQSPVQNGVLQTVCPVCTHPAYCVMYDGKTHPLINNANKECESGVENGGCGGAMSLAAASGFENGEKLKLKADTALNKKIRIIPGSVIQNGHAVDEETGTKVGAPDDEKVADTPDFMGCYQVKITYAPVMDQCAFNPLRVVSDLNPLKGKCMKTQSKFTVYDDHTQHL